MIYNVKSGETNIKYGYVEMANVKLYSKYYDMAGIEVDNRYSVDICYDLYYWRNIPGMKQVNLTLRYSDDSRYKHLCCVSIVGSTIKIDTDEDGGWEKFEVVNNITELYIRVKNALKSLPESVRNKYIRVLDTYIKEWSEGK